jgi:hypothetical protein
MSMEISDQELRSLVRDAIARASVEAPQRIVHAAPAGFRSHASHLMLPLARGSDGDGACLIEPTVRCNHCGYCLSFGH